MTACRRIPSVLLVAGSLLAAPAQAGVEEAQGLVDRARATVHKLFSSPDMTHLRQWVKSSRGVAVISNLLKAGFMLGAEGGQAVVLARDPKNGWSAPAFYAVGAGSIGLQVGIQSAEVILLIASDDALRSMVETKIKFGADLSVAAGPMGVGIGGATTPDLGADILSYALTRGVFLGVAVEGAVLAEEDALNRAYYGAGATARGILLERRFTNPGADGLIRALEGG